MEKNLARKIKSLRNEITPSQSWVALNKQVLLKQITSESKVAPKVGLAEYSVMVLQAFQMRFFQPAAVMLLVLGVFLGSSLTINAAFYSLPGENLYPVKLALEKTHVALIASEEKRVELKIEFAQKRVAELDKVVASSESTEVKKRKIEVVAKEFKNNVASVNEYLNKASKSNITPGEQDQKVAIAISVIAKTGELTKSLDNKINQLSEVEKADIKPIVDDAVESAEETTLSAQKIVDDANAVAQEDQITEQDGEVKGAATSENDPVVEETVEGSSEEPNSETVDTVNQDTQSLEQQNTNNDVIE